MSSPPSLVLIGPAAAGKSTIGAKTAKILGLPFVDLDDVGPDYYAEVGWSIERLVQRSRRVGRVAAEREWESARAHAVRRALDEHPGAVLALGAGHTSYTDPGCFAVVHAALQSVPKVVLLLPSYDREAALVELRQRSLASKGTEWISSGHDFLAEWLDDAGMRSLATETVITVGSHPDETAAQVAAGCAPGARDSPRRPTGYSTGLPDGPEVQGFQQ
ncbi:shikimate kinase [Arthrobacter sp. zg-Y1219]|uniref:shikimate kinase n=1 Tax=Arthrobacter sp. zg-Y1219 TaxID=3049067 RepID=UPI0024C325BA|nr:shikimate kinase [Arthrobacter sp. zg-Y1219]MDK1360410.1 shikimate kinase [Arthrobacter sp. zg-Y1219]